MSSKRSFFVTAVEIYHRHNNSRSRWRFKNSSHRSVSASNKKSGTFRKMDGETNTRLLSACGQVGHLVGHPIASKLISSVWTN
jgi:hypothetical protein